MSSSEAQISHNIKVHDRVAKRYERVHGEIYNPVEQARLRAKLGQALASVRSTGSSKRALDFGCGAGNLTRHLLELDAQVVSSDISPVFLDLIRANFAATGRSETFRLNGIDLAGLPDAAFDLAVTYSVLHHVPDYLAAVREMARVLRPGGVIYLDHEVNPGYWNPSPEYQAFRRLAVTARGWTRYFDPEAYVRKFRMKFTPAYFDEGDIHVHAHDHIEWEKVEGTLAGLGFAILTREDYLVYRRKCPMPVYEEYRAKCTDMRMLIARKAG